MNNNKNSNNNNNNSQITMTYHSSQNSEHVVAVEKRVSKIIRDKTTTQTRLENKLTRWQRPVKNRKELANGFKKQNITKITLAKRHT
jgi:hypothetical protein